MQVLQRLLVRRWLLLTLMLPCAAWSLDIIYLDNGNSLQGTVLRKDDAFCTVKMAYGTMEFAASKVVRIEHKDDPAPSLPPSILRDDRFIEWGTIIKALAAQSWAPCIKQIPATVIDVGIMRNVPYSSYRCGLTGNIEVNVYGDPDDPICYEVGLYGELASNATFQVNALTFVSEHILHKESNKKRVLTLDRHQETLKSGDLVLETTPADAPDAYGAWWIAVYFETRVEKARASDQEIAQISVPVSQVTAAPVASSTPSDTQADSTGTGGWSAADLSSGHRRSSSGHQSSAGGSCYVRSYQRKDGTYVRGHTRRR